MKYFKDSIQENKSNIDHGETAPFVFETIATLRGIKYIIIHTVKPGIADSRIITYELQKIGEEIER
jgi:hypothetical protein